MMADLHPIFILRIRVPPSEPDVLTTTTTTTTITLALATALARSSRLVHGSQGAHPPCLGRRMHYLLSCGGVGRKRRKRRKRRQLCVRRSSRRCWRWCWRRRWRWCWCWRVWRSSRWCWSGRVGRWVIRRPCECTRRCYRCQGHRRQWHGCHGRCDGSCCLLRVVRVGHGQLQPPRRCIAATDAAAIATKFLRLRLLDVVLDVLRCGRCRCRAAGTPSRAPCAAATATSRLRDEIPPCVLGRLSDHIPPRAHRPRNRVHRNPSGDLVGDGGDSRCRQAD